MIVDKLQPLFLFDDQRWQACLESFLDDLARRESRTTVVDYRTTLRLFFQGRDPEAVDHEAIETFCRRPTIYKSPPSGGTIKHRRKMLKLFYDHAVACGIYQGTNPAHLPGVEK